MPDLLDLAGKRALITGSSRGIGRACALKFAALGARVALHYGRDRRAGEVALAQLAGGGHALLQADIADPTAVEQLVTAAAAALGGLDVLVSNAGIFEEHPLLAVDYATWQAVWARTLATNLIGAANTIFCAAHYMAARGGGKIISVSSRTAFRGKPEAPAYVASKAGLNAMSQSLAQALGPHGVYVYVIAPGVVDTDMAASDKGTPGWAGIEAQSPLNRVCQPEEVAHVAAFLAADGSEYLTGSILDLFGASYLRT